MKLGVGSFLFRFAIGTPNFQPENPLDAIRLVELTHELGVEVLQFADNLPLDRYDHATLKKLRETAERLGITLEAGTAGATVERLVRYLDICKMIGAKLMRLSLHAPDSPHTIEETLNVLRSVMPNYEQAGVSIAIENHFTLTSPDLVSLVNQVGSPYLGICLDTANSIQQKEWPEETIKWLLPVTINLHLKDYKLQFDFARYGVFIGGCPLGEGEQNVDSVIKALQDAGRDVNIILESWMAEADSPEETLRLEMEGIRKSIAYARKFIPVLQM